MNKKDIIERLKLVGFKEYEAKVLVVLLKGIPLSVSEIAKEANLIRNSIYDTLRSFAEKGFCNEIETNTILKYQIIDPEIIIGKVEKEFEDSNKIRLSTLKDTFGELRETYKKHNHTSEYTSNSVELIRGFNKLRLAKYMELINSANSEILGMNRIKGLITAEINDFTKNFTSHGGVIKSIYKISLDFKVLKDEKAVNATGADLVKVCEMFQSFGEEVRLTTIEIPNMVIIDREKVYLNIMGDKAVAQNKQTDLIINDKQYTDNMCDLFESYWEKSATIEDYKSTLKEYRQAN
jgi:sugar-specific transcriptional regulator TrmB